MNYHIYDISVDSDKTVEWSVKNKAKQEKNSSTCNMYEKNTTKIILKD